MDKKEVKQLTKGCTVLVKATVESIQETKVYVHHGCISHPLPFSEIYSVPTQPEHDPCREFRKGDIVEPSEINGRLPQELRGCYRYEVIVGEGEMTNPLYVTVKPLLAANYKHLSEIHVNAAFLKLVTPVEDLEPYVICENDASYEVRLHSKKENHTMAIYNKNAYGDWLKARYAAEAECKRLNAEYRKEMEK